MGVCDDVPVPVRVGVCVGVFVGVFVPVPLGVFVDVPVPVGVDVGVAAQGRTRAISICLHIVPERRSSALEHEYVVGHNPQSWEQL